MPIRHTIIPTGIPMATFIHRELDWVSISEALTFMGLGTMATGDTAITDNLIIQGVAALAQCESLLKGRVISPCSDPKQGGSFARYAATRMLYVKWPREGTCGVQRPTGCCTPSRIYEAVNF